MEREITSILRELKFEIKKILQKDFVDLILFGSFSRGDSSEYSDIDILILVKKEPARDKNDKIDDLIARYSLKHDTVISGIIYPLGMFEKYSTPFLLNVKEEGIRI